MTNPEKLLAEATDQPEVAYDADPTLGQNVNLLEMLFDRMPMGIAIIDRDFRLVRCNPTWAAFIEQYTPSKSIHVLPGTSIFDLEPGTEEVLIPLFEKVFAGETIRQDGVRIESGGIESFWDTVLTPLYEREEVVGLLNVSIDATERVQVNQTLEQRVAERTREIEHRHEVAESLRDILTILNSDRPANEIYDYITSRSCELFQSDASLLFRLQGHQAVLEAGYHMPESLNSLEQTDIYPGRANQELIKRQPVVIHDAVSYIQGVLDEPGLSASQRIWYETILNNFQSYLAVPLIVRNQIFGGLIVYFKEKRAFTEEDIHLGLTLGEQAALAIENTRLRSQVEQNAISAERNRLARDLHDAVTQTLFSASLIADALPKLWERNPETGRKKLDELRVLTRGALSEMRTLLLELRPAVLVETDLGDLIRHLTNAFTARTRIPVKTTLDGQVDPLLEVKEVYYRIAQEALNNIYKHAEASQVWINLICLENQVELLIRDNGRGFHLQSVSPESLGIGIMRERAQTIGARLDIESQIGEGTCIEMKWKDGDE